MKAATAVLAVAATVSGNVTLEGGAGLMATNTTIE
jgi:hypothetical protein